MAIELLIELNTPRMSITSATEIREAIESLPPSQLLQTTIGDFWLGLTKGEGRARRNFHPTPPNPFTHGGRSR